MLLEQWDFRAAFKVGQEALAIDPNWRVAHIAIAYPAAMTGNFAEAQLHADLYIAALQPGDWNGFDLRGDIFSLAEQFDEALAASEKVYRWAKIAMASMHKGGFDGAERVLKDLIARQGGTTSMGGALGFMGDIQVCRGYLNGARSWLERGVRAYNQHPWFGGMLLWKAAQVYLEQVVPRPFSIPLIPSRFTPGVLVYARWLSWSWAKQRKRNPPWPRCVIQSARCWATTWRRAIKSSTGCLVPFIATSMTRWWTLQIACPQTSGTLRAGCGPLQPRAWKSRCRRVLAHKTQLCFGQVGLYEGHNLLAFLLGEFYLAQLAMRRGRKDEGNRKFEFFLQHFRHSTARLTQIKEAEAALKA
jgi:tetratricopeptide (TPR) repeat protein